MRAPKKVIAAMAMATLIGTGVGQAFAADFEHSTGDAQGQGMQKAVKDINKILDESQKKVEGDIQITGTFNKTVTNLPEVKEAGKYLRVTMPLALNYNYDLNTNVMNSVAGTITNSSVEANLKPDVLPEQVATLGEEAFNLKDKGVKMSFVGIENNNESVEYVKNIKPNEHTKAQLPFKLVIKKSNGEPLRSIDLVDLVKDSNGSLKKQIPDLTIESKNNISMKIEQIDGQKVQDGDKLNGHTVISPLTLKFQYNE